MLMRLRNIRLVGLRNGSPSEMVGNLERQAARREHAARNRLDQLGQQAVAVVEPARGIAGADHGPLEHRLAELFDGFSIGSNDLTQLTLGVDRDSEMVAFDFDERDPGCAQLPHSCLLLVGNRDRPMEASFDLT
jgi:PEP-utilising enzyme, PEP-binding domain